MNKKMNKKGKRKAAAGLLPVFGALVISMVTVVSGAAKEDTKSFELKLSGNPTTGYEWQCEAKDPDLVKIDLEYIPDTDAADAESSATEKEKPADNGGMKTPPAVDGNSSATEQKKPGDHRGVQLTAVLDAESSATEYQDDDRYREDDEDDDDNDRDDDHAMERPDLPNRPMTGVGGHYDISVIGLKPGTTEISLRYARSWEKDSLADMTYTLEIGEDLSVVCTKAVVGAF